jgi:hypothetical protein
MFLALLVGSATLGTAYNVARLPGDIAARHQFHLDPSCHPSGGQPVAAGACRVEPVKLIGDLQHRLGRGGPYLAMDVQAQDGSTEEVIASDAMAGQLRQPGATLSRMVFRGKAVAYLSGAVIERTENSPSVAVFSREFSILYWVLIGAVFGIVSWLRFRVHVEEYDSEHQAG